MSPETSQGLDPNNALRQIFKDPAWKLHAGIGSLLNATALVMLGSGKFAVPLLPVAFLVWAAAQGYLLKVVRTQIKDSAAPLPGWSGWSDLLISGLTWIAIICAQVVVVISLIYFSLVLGSLHGCLNALTPQFPVWAYSTIGAALMIMFITTFFFPLLMANFAEKEKVTAAFSVGLALQRLSKRPGEFLLVWLLSTGVSSIAFLVPLFTVIGLFFMPLTTFLAGIFNAIILAQVWREAK